MSSASDVLPALATLKSASIPKPGRRLMSTLMVSACAFFGAALYSGAALAQDDEEEVAEPGDEEAPPAQPGASMDSEGDDPVATEGFDKDARFVPRSQREEEVEGDAGLDLNAELTKPLRLELDVLFGFGESPVPGPTEARTPSATVISFRAGLSYAVSPEISLGLDLPWATASYEDTPSALDESSNALGNPMLRFTYRLTAGRWLIPLRFGVGIPVGQGEPDLTSSDTARVAQSQLHLVTDSARGLREGEYYAVGRMPVSLGAGIERREASYELGARQTVLVMPKLSGDISNPGGLGPGTAELSSMALRSVTEAAFDFWFIEQLAAGLHLWFVYDAITAVKYEPDRDVTQPSPTQFVIEPRLRGRLDPVTLQLGYLVPLGGQLGDAGISGLRLAAEAQF
ncbi:MAG: hypothetical protein KIT72_04575 [Polyangiaceae bacterium]|nr:hypothetical protein [Polyangiaceae bacterium]MCW5789678.1 hypothetical protein [Polyangiaceae bacterium]